MEFGSAAIPVLEICDLPAPKRPLGTGYRPAALWWPFRQSGHSPATNSSHRRPPSN